MATDPNTELPTQTKSHEKFNASDADVIIQSSDGVRFHLHRKYLEVNSGVFPGSDSAAIIRSDGQGEITHLTEPANVLEILFDFIYPRRHPNLEGLEFRILAPLAEAVEKYEVFAAMGICELRLKSFMKTYPAEILVHGIKHDYSQLMNEAASILSGERSLPLSSVLQKLPPGRSNIAWVLYQESRKAVFDMALLKLGIRYQPLALMEKDKIGLWLCTKCAGALAVWIVWLLQQAPTLEKLKSHVDRGFPETGKKVVEGCCQALAIQYEQKVKAALWGGIDSIPPFSDFMNDALAAREAASLILGVKYSKVSQLIIRMTPTHLLPG